MIGELILQDPFQLKKMCLRERLHYYELMPGNQSIINVFDTDTNKLLLKLD